MKLIAFFLIALSWNAFAQDSEPPKTEELKSVPTVDLAELREKRLQYEGKVVRLRFNFRDPEVMEMGDMFQGALHHYDSKRRQWLNNHVLIPAAGKEAYLKLNPQNTGRSYSLYGRILKGGMSHIAVIYGRELRAGTKGPELIW